MRPLPALPVLLFAAVVVAAMGFQQKRLGALQRELRTLQADLASVAGPEAPQPEDIPPGSDPGRPVAFSTPAPTDRSLARRVESLEDAVAYLAEANEHLMERGQLPLSAAKTEELLSRLSDGSAPDRDRLQALRLLRRNEALGDDALQHALQWLQGTTNAATRTRLVQQLAGLTNAALRDPLLALAVNESNPEVRQRAIGGLRAFVNDPQVEAQLWGLLQSESTGAIRRQVREALTDGPLSEARQESLRQRAVSGTASLDERALAWEALKGSGNANPQVSASLAQLAMTTTDTGERLRLFETFNSASDPAFVPSLVQGLQDPDPQVRARAADALSDFRSDPAVAEWFQYVVANDPDAAVRRQAARAMAERSGRGGGNGSNGNGPPRFRGQGQNRP